MPEPDRPRSLTLQIRMAHMITDDAVTFRAPPHGEAPAARLLEAELAALVERETAAFRAEFDVMKWEALRGEYETFRALARAVCWCREVSDAAPSWDALPPDWGETVEAAFARLREACGYETADEALAREERAEREGEANHE